MPRSYKRLQWVMVRICMLLVAAMAIPVMGQVPDRLRTGSGQIHFMPVAELGPGMTGTGYTVILGGKPEPFDAEILGVLKDVYPDQDIVVARLRGLGLEETGVLAGMSGSPVYVDDALVGAVAYRLVDFGREAIAGIIPIENMLRLQMQHTASNAKANDAQVARVLAAVAAAVSGKGSPMLSADLFPATSNIGLEPIATPVAVSGFQPQLTKQLAPLFAGLGWHLTAGGVGGLEQVEAQLEPGGAVAVQLMTGDMSVTATGTITHLDGDHLFAFGHPFLQGGNVDFPMTGAHVITVLNSAASSSKLTIAGTDVMGSIRQDRLAGIYGVLGEVPEMIPVHLMLDDGTGNERRFVFELVSDKLLTPLYLFVGLFNGVQSIDKVFGDSSLRVTANLDLEGYAPLSFSNLFSSESQAAVMLSRTIASIFTALHSNEFELIHVNDIDLRVEVDNRLRTAQITRVWSDRQSVRPGDSVILMVGLKPYRLPEIVERIRITVPEGTGPGPLTLLIGDAATISREEESFIQGSFSPKNIGHLVRLLSSIRRNDRIIIQMSRPDEGGLVSGEVMPSLPPSVLEILSAQQSRGEFVPLRRSVLLEQEQEVDFVVAGSHRIQLVVER